MPKIVTIMIADDHAIVRTGLKALLEDVSEFKVVAEAETGIEALEKAAVYHPDIAILDIRMPGMSGIEVCRQLHQTLVTCKIVILTAYAEDELLFAAIQAGASGYILKQVAGSEFIQAIKRISAGEGILDSAMTISAFKLVRKAAEAQDAASFDPLSSQEKAVLNLISKGLTNRQIAVKLYLGEGTIRNYVSAILTKLVVSNRAQAAAFAVEHKLEELLARS